MMPGMDILLMLPLALAADFLLGEPPKWLHPVVWIGKTISLVMKGNQGQEAPTQFVYGMGIVFTLVSIFALAAVLLLDFVRSWNYVAYIVLGALLLKSTFSVKGLFRAGGKVRDLLEAGKLPDARGALDALVSRETDDLSEESVVSAVVESVAEGGCDSFVAPLFYFLILGVPGAVAYRVINTFDSMIGYHGNYEHVGKFAAWTDDVANYLPARITAFLMLIVASVRRAGGQIWTVTRREQVRTESPNAGWPIAAMSSSLGVQLEKPGHYRIGKPGRPLKPAVITESLKLAGWTFSVWAVVCLVTGVIIFVL